MLDIPEIEGSHCGSPDVRALNFSPAPCDSTAENTPEFSSKFRHGGLRENSGGARENSGGARPGAGRPRNPVPLVEPIGTRWYVYQTHPQAERLAASELTRAGYRSYAPMIAVRRQDPVIPSMFHKILVSRFTGYGFVELGPTEPWLPILEEPGIARMLLDSSGRHPSPVGVGIVELHQADDDRLCDLARETMPCLEVGTRVTVIDGAMTSFGGPVLECDGLVTMVEVNLFGRLIPTGFARSSVVETV
jgi:transcription antitermination factor NusG